MILFPLIDFLLTSPYFFLAHFIFMETIPPSLVLRPVTLLYNTVCLAFHPRINLLLAFVCSMCKVKWFHIGMVKFLNVFQKFLWYMKEPKRIKNNLDIQISLFVMILESDSRPWPHLLFYEHADFFTQVILCRHCENTLCEGWCRDVTEGQHRMVKGRWTKRLGLAKFPVVKRVDLLLS